MPKETNPQKKYWWLLLIVVPVVLAVIQVFPELGKKEDKAPGGTTITQSGTGNTAQAGTSNIQQNGGVNILNSDLSSKMFVANISLIEDEYAKTQGQALTNGALRQQIEHAFTAAAAGQHAEAGQLLAGLAGQIQLPAVYNNLGVEQAKAGNHEAARKSFDQAIAMDPDFAGANLNRGLVDVSQGRLTEALPALQKASGMDDSQSVLAVVQQELKQDVHAMEIEPNNDLFHANRVAMDTKIQAAISDDPDVDCFQFTTPPKYRDIVQISIENRSTTLAPGINLYDANKSLLVGNQYNDTKGANLEYAFPAPPGITYYVQVYGRWSSGDYFLTVKSLKKYDAYEPNDDILHPAIIALNTPINASIMDEADTDFYQFKTTAQSGQIKVSIENRSATLAPGINLFDANKSLIVGGQYNDTKGANLEYLLSAQTNATYYLQVYGRWSSGDYTLTLTPQ